MEFFGLDQSKYQWAVDEVIERQMVSSIFSGFLCYLPNCLVNILVFLVFGFPQLSSSVQSLPGDGWENGCDIADYSYLKCHCQYERLESFNVV